MRLLSGNKAPNFQREDIFGQLIHLEDYVGQKVLLSFYRLLAVQAAREGVNPKHIDGEMNLIPADFLIRPDMTIHRAYYGQHIGDHIPFDEIERFLEPSS